MSEISTISAYSYGATGEVPTSSRFEIVQRQLALAHLRNTRNGPRNESMDYLQSFVGTGTPNIYESACVVPNTAAPSMPPSDEQPDTKTESDSYYTNAVLSTSRK